MKVFVLFILLFSFAYSKVYYSKVDPYEVHTVTSNVSGEVIYMNEDALGKKLGTKPYLMIDDRLDIKELAALKDKIEYLREMVTANDTVLRNLEESLKRKRVNFKKINAMTIKSDVEKDQQFYDLVNSENQLLSTQKENDNLKVQITDLKLRRAQVEKSIHDKNLQAKGLVLYALNVKLGQVVNLSTPLAEVADTSRAKLTIYLDAEDLKDIKTKTIYIDGKKTDYKIGRILNIADSKNISKYMAQIIIAAPKVFSKLAKVEFR